MKIQPLTVHRTISHEDEQQQQEIQSSPMMRALQEIWDNYDSFPFRYPVDPSVPGYYAIIKYPMDLSTIQDKIRSGQYSDFENLCRDLRLMFDNCFTFNQPESLIYDQALRLRQFAYRVLKKTFPEKSKIAKRHLTASEPIIIVPDHLKPPAPLEPVPIPKLKLSLPVPIPAAALTPSPKIVIAPFPPPKTDHEKLQEILDKLKNHQHAYWFSHPIDPVALGIPTYFEIIKEPMDFATVTANLEDNKYEDEVSKFYDHIQLIFNNAKLFNPSNTLVHQHAVQLEKLFHRMWNKEFPTTTGTVPIVGSPKRRRTTMEPSAPPSSPGGGLKIKFSLSVVSPAVMNDWDKDCKKVLELVKAHETAGPFLDPVDPVALGCPTYYDEIKSPMDLSTMSRKLASHRYADIKDFSEDLKLIVKNCVKFNGKHSNISKMAYDLQSYFTSLMDEHGL